MIANLKPGSIAVTGESVVMSRDTVRSGALRVKPQHVGVSGIDQQRVLHLGMTGLERFYARFARTADCSRLETELAAGSPRLKGVVGECPRDIPV